MQHMNSAKKRDNVSIATSNFILCSLLGSTVLQGSILCSLFVIYIKSNHIVSTVPANLYYFSLLYARTLAGKLNPYLKANLNEHPSSMCHITICSEKFQSQCKEQTITTKLL